MKHVWFLTIIHITKLQQTIATSQHIWLLTSKLIKKTANMTSSQIPNVNVAYSVSYMQKHGTLHKSKKQMCNMSGFGKCKLPLFHGVRVQNFHDLDALNSLVTKTARALYVSTYLVLAPSSSVVYNKNAFKRHDPFHKAEYFRITDWLDVFLTTDDSYRSQEESDPSLPVSSESETVF